MRQRQGLAVSAAAVTLLATGCMDRAPEAESLTSDQLATELESSMARDFEVACEEGVELPVTGRPECTATRDGAAYRVIVVKLNDGRSHLRLSEITRQ